MKIRHLATVTNSNVDKVIDTDEIPVRLCNYVDVYKNDFIQEDMEFSSGSATPNEVLKFRLKVGDVIITKDSEDRADIGVPAFVRSASEDVVCGYHLTMLRADPRRIIGKFLFWALQTKTTREGFSNAALGVTRYGLSLVGMKDIKVPVPDLEIQEAIANFLERETTRIDQLIEKRQTFLSLIDEKKATLAAKVVDGSILDKAQNGLTGWFGTLLEEWETRRAKFLFRERQERSETGDEELLSVSHLTGVTKRSEKDVNMFLAESNEGYKLVSKNDVVINTMWAWMGAMGVSPVEGLISPSYGVYEPITDNYEFEYFDLLLRSKPFIAEATRRSKGIHSSRLRLYPDAFLDILLPIPPREEQAKILAAFHAATQRGERLARLSRQSLDRLREFRSALITAAVTGQIDVTTWGKRGNTDRRLDAIEEEMTQQEARA